MSISRKKESDVIENILNKELHLAICDGDLDLVDKLLEKPDIDVNAKSFFAFTLNNEDQTPLMTAVKKSYEYGKVSLNHLKIIQRLLNKNADPNIQNNWNQTALDIAVEKCFPQVVSLLFPVTKSNPDRIVFGNPPHSNDEDTTLSNWLETVTVLEKSGVDLKAIWTKEKAIELFSTLFHYPVSDEFYKTIDFIISRLNAEIIYFNSNEILALLVARIKEKSVFKNCLDKFLNAGLDINATGSDFNPIDKAIRYNPLDVNNIAALEVLIESGVDFNRHNAKNITPLHIAAAGNPKETECLINAGAYLYLIDDEKQDVIEYSKKECIRQLEFFDSSMKPEYRDEFIKKFTDAQDLIIKARLKQKALLNQCDSPEDKKNEPAATVSNLTELVKIGDLKKIQAVVAHEKNYKGWKWQYEKNRSRVENAIRTAILLEKIDIVTFLLDAGVPAKSSAPEHDGSNFHISLATFACTSGNLEMVKLLVQRGAVIKPHRYNHGGDDNPIKAAVEGGHVDIVAYLLEKGSNPNATWSDCSFYGESFERLLSRAAANNNFKIMELLLNHGASIKSALAGAHQKFKYDLKKDKAVSEALQSTYALTAKNIMDYAAGVVFSIMYRKSKTTCSHFELIGIDLLESIDISEFNFIGASIENTPITREILIEKGFKGADKALVSIKDLENLSDQVRQERIKQSLDMCISKMGSLISDSGIVNLIPLWCAAEFGDIAAVKTRFNANVDPNQGLGDEDPTPIALAAKAGHFEIVKLLAEHPLINKESLTKLIKYRKHSNFGNSLLHIAASAGNLTAIQILVDIGAKIDAKNYNDQTPLQLAAKSSKEAEKLLIELGADISVLKNNKEELQNSIVDKNAMAALKRERNQLMNNEDSINKKSKSDQKEKEQCRLM